MRKHIAATARSVCKELGLVTKLQHVLVWICFLVMAPQTSSAQSDVYSMSLTELAAFQRSTGATLTRTDVRRTPAAVTRISRGMIELSGARSLDELLDFFVPNFVRLRQAALGPDIGLRGIIGARDNKTLLLVNGHIVNQKTLIGAVPERFIPMLDDIAQIEVVRGPGSSVFGPGAINGVISITTLDGTSFQGIDVRVRKGMYERFFDTGIRAGASFGKRSGVFGYFGMSEYQGSDAKYSPVVFSKNSAYFNPGVPVDSNLVRDNSAAEFRPHKKIHLQANIGGVTAWVRRVNGSISYLPARSTIEGGLRGFDRAHMQLTYQLSAGQISHRMELPFQLAMDARVSWDRLDYVRLDNLRAPGDFEYGHAMREDELNLRGMLSWTPSDRHSIAAGYEQSKEWFGEAASSLTDDPWHQGNRQYEPWSTLMRSVFAEYQGSPLSWLTVFAGGRIDEHSFTHRMKSPKVAIVFTPFERHTTKFIYNRSIRKSDDLELRMGVLADSTFLADTEVIRALELQHTMDFGDVEIAIIVFENDADINSWVANPIANVVPVGNEVIRGLEIEYVIRRRRWATGISYAYTKLVEFTLEDEGIRNQMETSEPYGYGDDLQHWPRNNARIQWRWSARRQLMFSSSLRSFWGWDGAKSYLEYNNNDLRQNSLSRSDSDDRTQAFQGSLFLSGSVHLNVTENDRLSLHVHNALGWLSPDLNKRNFYGRMAGYRVEAAAVSINLKMSF